MQIVCLVGLGIWGRVQWMGHLLSLVSGPVMGIEPRLLITKQLLYH